MFYKNGEIPMYTYLTNTLHTAKIDTLLYVYGITSDDYLTKYNLELYYISYEKTHSVLNFVIGTCSYVFISFFLKLDYVL